MFTNYKLDPVSISTAAVAAAASLAKSNPGESPARFAAGVIARRLRAAPQTYVRYGPYWWTVKAVLRSAGEDFGAGDDEVMRGEYAGGAPAYEALVAAEQFREHYLGTWLDGTAEFDLTDEPGGRYVLFDADMEARRLGPAGVLAMANIVSRPVETGADGAVFDSVPGEELAAALKASPFAVEFPLDGQLWTAHVYGGDRAAAVARLDAMLDSGRIGSAVDKARGIGVEEPVLMGDRYDAPVMVDLGRRVVLDVESAGLFA